MSGIKAVRTSATKPTHHNSNAFLLQRKCACGGSAGLTGECSDCQSKIFARNRFQTKLRVNEPGNEYEQDADRVAAQVMRMPDSKVNPKNSHLLATLLVQRHIGEASSGVEQAPPLVQEVLSSSGQPLDSETRAFFEPRFGHDFSRVRVHSSTAAEESARDVNAQAYTVGDNIAFGAGRFAPKTHEGRRLLAHELTHVVQQGGAEHALMRACDCTSFGGRQPDPNDPNEAGVSEAFPRLVSGDWCVIEPSTPNYNCFAWSISDKTQWIESQIDSVYGDGDGKPSFADFDAFYAKTLGLHRQKAPDSDTLVALFAVGTHPIHAALTAGPETCGMVPFTSKLGGGPLIAHDLYQLEGSDYGKVVHYYG